MMYFVTGCQFHQKKKAMNKKQNEKRLPIQASKYYLLY